MLDPVSIVSDLDRTLIYLDQIKMMVLLNGEDVDNDVGFVQSRGEGGGAYAEDEGGVEDE